MTSPSWPVKVRPGSPSMEVASINSTSPPVPVTARPVATPGTEVRSADSGVNVGRLQPGFLDLPWQQVVAGDGDLLHLGVAVQRDQLHPVGQRAGDVLLHV